ncbi:hypothetical protein Tco_0958613, partial [Tanacetum coccineum]
MMRTLTWLRKFELQRMLQLEIRELNQGVGNSNRANKQGSSRKRICRPSKLHLNKPKRSFQVDYHYRRG